MTTSRISLACIGALMLSLFSIACDDAHRSESTAPPTEQSLVVFAASSLREGFESLGAEFKRAHPGVTVTFNFAGTQELRLQIEQGAPADVIASADTTHMGFLVRQQLVAEPVVFARNEPVMIVAKEQAAQLRAFADLAKASRIVVGAAEVPIGRYTAQILEHAESRISPEFVSQVNAHVVSRELNVKQVLAKVSLGEADAGIVYCTDARAAADRVAVVSIPADLNVIAEYPIARVTHGKSPELAAQWIACVRSTQGQRVLAEAGFLSANPEQAAQ